MPKRAGTSRIDPPRNPQGAARGDAPPTDVRLAWIERTRVYRGRRELDHSISAMAALVEHAAAQRQRALGDVIDLWIQLAPDRVRDYATIEGLGQGTLTLSVASSSASFEVSRALRDGLEKALIARMTPRIKRVKVRVTQSQQTREIG